VLLSNHGGRQLDFARSAIEVLPEVMKALKEINYDPSKFEVFIDGGIRRGSDILKALALGELPSSTVSWRLT
jgi:L-lactate dehydrogenase (cytochrome)